MSARKCGHCNGWGWSGNLLYESIENCPTCDGSGIIKKEESMQTEIKMIQGNPDASAFIDNAASHLAYVCHAAALKAGWWGGNGKPDPRDNPMCFAQKLMLIVSELSEAMEGDRKDLMDDKLPNRKMREVELADAVIRIFDTAGAFGMDIGGAIVEKMAFNAIRPDHKPEARNAVGGKTY